LGCEVDHIISEKHGGPTELANLANACVFCNRAKGTDIGAGTFCRFFNPRVDLWGDHFELDGAQIKSQTDVGEVTVRIFEFNTLARLLERRALSLVHRYPSAAAVERMKKRSA
jgi:hypothetical protein